MTSTENTAFVKQILLEACEKIGQPVGTRLTSDPSGTSQDELTFSIGQNASNEIVLMAHYSGGAGIAEMNYSPQRLIENLVAGMANRRDKTKTLEQAVPVQVFEEIWRQKLISLCSVLIVSLFGEFEDSTREYPRFWIQLEQFLTSEDIAERTDAEKFRLLGKLLSDRGSVTAQRILDMESLQVSRLVAPPHLFSYVYNQQRELWKNAKRLYKGVEAFKNKLDIVMLAFEDLPSDQIQTLADPDKYSTMPSALALTSTARILNVPGGLRSRSSLERYLRESKKEASRMSEASLATDLKTYLMNSGRTHPSLQL